jgi:hypothetical protein
MAEKKGTGQRQSQRDKERAAYLRARGVTRTTGVCSVCYHTVTVDSWKSRYSHRCWR